MEERQMEERQMEERQMEERQMEERQMEERQMEEGKLEKKQNEKNIYTLLNNTNVSEELSNYEKVSDINQNKNIISNVSQTQLDTIQGEDYNHCK